MTLIDAEAHLLGTERIAVADRTMHHVGVCIVEQMQRVARFRLPRERLDEPRTVHGDHSIWTTHPVNRILQKLAEIAISGTPAGAINVPGKIGDSRLSNLLENCGRLGCAWRARISHFWRECRIRGNNTQ